MENLEKRGIMSWTLIIVGALVTLGIIGFFFVKMVTNNPLTGTWYQEESDVTFIFSEEDTVTIVASDQDTGEKRQLKFHYQRNKDNKIVNLDLLEGASEDLSSVTAQLFGAGLLEDNPKLLDTQFEYSVQGDILSLLERDYGEKIELKRQ